MPVVPNEPLRVAPLQSGHIHPDLVPDHGDYPEAFAALMKPMAPGMASAGADNFSLPFVGLVGRMQELLRLQHHESNRYLLALSWLAHAALLTQIAYLLLRPQRDSVWWRMGVLHVLLALVLLHLLVIRYC